MEALSLLRYWRTNAGDGTTKATVPTTTTIVTGVTTPPSETADEEEEEDDKNDHGPFFDIEFSLPEQDEPGAEQYTTNEQECYHNIEECERSEFSAELDNEREVNFTLLTSSSSGDSTTDVHVSDSPSSDLFFRGSFVPVDHTTDDDGKSKPPQFRLGLMKPATKFRIMMLKFRKSKMNSESNESTESNTSSCPNSKQVQQKQTQNEESTDSGNMTVKLKVEEVPNVSLFKRHNSSKPPKKKQTENETVSGSSEDKKFSKETMQRYIRKVKPLYVRVSQKYSEKLKFTGNLTFPGVTKANLSPSTSTHTETQKDCLHTNPKKEKQTTTEVDVAGSEPEPEPPLLQSTGKGLKQGNLPAGLRVVCKHFGKTWSASTAIAAATGTASVGATGALASNRRDDSLIQQQDGIQSAILHCKRSFKASRDSDSSSSDPAPATGKSENG